jgi:ADP-heptose:LPS heptosyltransferase
MEILMIRPGALGDTLMLMPAFHALRREATITFVGRRPGLDFIRPYVFRVSDMESAGWHQLFMQVLDPGASLPVPAPDQAIAFLGDEDGLVSKNLTRFFPGIGLKLFPALPAEGENLHAAQYILECLKAAGLPIDPSPAMMVPHRKALLAETVSIAKKRYVVVHPGSGDPRKNYPPPFWVKILKQLLHFEAAREHKLFVLLGPAEAALRNPFEEALISTNGEICFCPDAQALMELFSRTSLYLGHDSGITHLAAMTGAPTIALFKHSNLKMWRPLGPRVTVLREAYDQPRLMDQIFKTIRALPDFLPSP